MKLLHESDAVTLVQKKYVYALIENIGLCGSKGLKIPSDPSQDLRVGTRMIVTLTSHTDA